MGSGRYPNLLTLERQDGSDDVLNFGSDIEKLLNIRQIMASIQRERDAMRSQKQEQNVFERIRNGIEVSFCEALTGSENQFIITLEDCTMYRKQCTSVPMRRRGGGTVLVDS